MTRFVRCLAAAFLASLAIALPARATTFSTDFTDIWWAGLAENGWGVTVSQQGDILFATFFIYGADGTARWFSGALSSVAGPVNASTFSGDLFRSTGTFYGTNPFAGATGSKVGTVTMSFNTAATATLNYTIDGVAVTKQISRQSFRGNNLAGSYSGGLVSDRTNCSDSTLNGVADATGQVLVTHTDSGVVIEVDAPVSGGTAVCVFRGNYTPFGRLGSISNGTWSCVVGTTTVVQGVAFSMTSIDGQVNGFHANFTATDQGSCIYNGRFGGVRNP